VSDIGIPVVFYFVPYPYLGQESLMNITIVWNLDHIDIEPNTITTSCMFYTQNKPFVIHSFVFICKQNKTKNTVRPHATIKTTNTYSISVALLVCLALFRTYF